MTKQITLYTSLPPKLTRCIGDVEIGPSYLAECIKSWKSAGFDVVSLNHPREIDELRKLGYDIEYRPVRANRPRIADFIDAIRESGKPVAGITNADIFLADHPALLNAILYHAASAMVILERTNIDPFSLRPTGITCNGFDVCFFSTAPLSRIDMDVDFLFGQPWWDYWFPLAYASVGGRLMTTDAPLLFHLNHELNWQQAQWVANAKKTVKYFLKSPGQLPDDFVAQLQRFSGSTDVPEGPLGPFSFWCFDWLRKTPDAIRTLPPPGSDNPLPTLIASFDDPETRDLIGELNEAQAKINALKEREVRRSRLHEEITVEALQKLLARLFDEIERMSVVMDGRKFRSDDEALGTVASGVHMLTSRKATLRHFFWLNSVWFERKYLAGARAWVRHLRSSKPGDEADRRQFRFAKEEGEKYLASIDYRVKAAQAGGMKNVGDYIVAFVQGKAQGMYDRSSGDELEWIDPQAENCHIEIAVLDAVDKRFVPELKIGVKLLDADRYEVADVHAPFVWHPGFYHYGANVKLAKGGRYDLLVTIDPPTFMRHDRASGKRYSERVRVMFEGVRIQIE